jgi:ABC-2 type transport system permease protein
VIGIEYAVADLVIPFHHAPKVLTGAPFEPGPTVMMLIISAVGLLGLRRRDLR